MGRALTLVATLTTLALGTGVVLESARTAGAALPAGGPAAERLADMDVRMMVSSDRPDGLWRALVGDDGGVPYLVVERFDPAGLAADAGLPAIQRRIDRFAFGGGLLTFAGQAEALDGLALGPRTLSFVVLTGAEPLACTLDLRGAYAFAARCDAPPGDDGAGPAAHRPRWATRPEVIAACQAAFYAATAEALCLDTVDASRFAPAGVIAACDAATFGDANALDCLRKAAVAGADPSRTLAACDAAMYGDTHALACFEVALRAPWDAAAAVAACDAAMYGDDNALRCVAAAVRAHATVASTIAACDRAHYGDDATLACVDREASL